MWSAFGRDLGADMRDYHASTSESALQGNSNATGMLMGLVLDSTDAGAGIEDFFENLAGLTAEILSRPDREVTCAITVMRRKRLRSSAGRTMEGAASSLRIPLALDDENSAVVDLCSSRPGAFSAEDVAEAEEFLAVASQALLLALRISQLSDSRDDLAAAMQSRTIIDMAIGAIMGQNRCRRDAAFKILRNTSNNRNMKIRDVAATLIASIAGDTDTSARFEE